MMLFFLVDLHCKISLFFKQYQSQTFFCWKNQNSDFNENVYSDKLLIAVNTGHDEVVNCEDSHEFDPADTLERNLDKRNELSRSELDVEDTSQEIQEVIVGKHFKTLFIHKVIQIYLYANHS